MNDFGLLIEKVVMVYVGFLEEVDMNLFYEIGMVVVYCLIFNVYFGNVVILIVKLVY